MGDLRSSLNTIVFSGVLEKDDLRRLLATLHNLERQGYKSANIDLKGLTRVFAPQLLPIAVYCRRLLHKGFETLLELPEDTKLKRLFLNCNWAYLIDPRSYGLSDLQVAQHLPATIYSNPEEQFRAVDQAVNLVLRSLELNHRRQLEAIEWSINEIADNVLNHANSAIGGVLQVTARPDHNLIEFVVCDSGYGIPKTLREGHQRLSSDVEALDQAIREGVTRNQATNMGNGLFGTFRLAELSNGYFSIYSGYASLTYSERYGLHASAEKIPYAGTALTCAINISNPDLLSEALTFKGKRHNPSYTTFDRLEEGSEITLNLSSEAASFGSRPAARPIKVKLDNLLKTTNSRVIVDLEGVALVTSSFADEVFGKLFVEIGPLNFMSRVSIKGGSRIVRQLIDRAIAQRSSIGVQD